MRPATVPVPSPSPSTTLVNVGVRLSATARQMPDGVAVAVPKKRDRAGRRQYDRITFAALDDDSNRIAAGMRQMGVSPGTRLVLMVRPGIEFISLTFALFKAGAVTVLIDPGMGRANVLECLAEVEPEGFVALPLVQAARALLRWRFPKARWNVTVGSRWFWRGPTLAELRKTEARDFVPAPTGPDDPAAIIFTTGSTGPPKGVLYRHANFDAQADAIRDFYDIQPGEIDLAGFPLFALFNCAMGVTTVVPDMDPARPARVDPRNIIEAACDWNVTQAFGSPAIWNAVGRYCEKHGQRLPSVRRVLSAGAPVPPHVLRRMKETIHPEGDVHTPYGATEALPVASISASRVLGETAARSAQGAGTCVGRRFPGMEWKVIDIHDGPLPALSRAQELPRGQIGELIVRGPVVTTEYVTRLAENALAKIADGETFWHRMGDVGYLDDEDRFWFCGRKAHRVLSAAGPMFTIPCEAIYNAHERVYRSALVGIGPPPRQRPVMVVECWPERRPASADDRRRLIAELLERGRQHPHTRSIEDVLIHPSLPVDIRHNAKIFREKLAAWAAGQLRA
jgi:acyl-CoA synthetase (AMP-forming)/AMP-acid ligase II